MGELQARRDAQTRAELSSVAIGLFASKGFVETTMDEVAAAAGVSRRTAYRHYPNKEDLIFEHSRQWLEVFHATVAAEGEADSIKERCSRAVLAVARTIEATRDDVLVGYAVVASTPMLRAGYARTNRDWLDAYTELLCTDIDDDDHQATLNASILAGALVGGTDRAATYWSTRPETSLVGLTQAVLDATEPLWP